MPPPRRKRTGSSVQSDSADLPPGVVPGRQGEPPITLNCDDGGGQGKLVSLFIVPGRPGKPPITLNCEDSGGQGKFVSLLIVPGKPGEPPITLNCHDGGGQGKLVPLSFLEDPENHLSH